MIKFLSALVLFISAPSIEARRVPECGVEKYKLVEHEVCGVEEYHVRSTQYCGTKEYYSGHSMQCPGSKRNVIYDGGKTWNQFRNSERVECPSYAKEVGRTLQKEMGRGRRDTTYIIKAVSIPRCDIPGYCARREFGTKTWKSCKHPNHPVKKYIACRKPQFGVELYKDCNIRKTRKELEALFSSLETNKEIMAIKMLTYKADILKYESSPQRIACFIEKWKSDELSEEIVKDLVVNFDIFTGEEYSPELAFKCDQKSLESTSPNCTEGSTGQICKLKGLEAKIAKWFEDSLQELQLLTNDLLARQDTDIKDKITAYIEEFSNLNQELVEVE